jgi:hypothetical protein
MPPRGYLRGVFVRRTELKEEEMAKLLYKRPKSLARCTASVRLCTWSLP